MPPHTSLRFQTDALADLLTGADPALPVPTCPGWTLADLSSHVGGGQRWAAALVRRGTPPPQPRDRAPADPGPWLREGSDLLEAAVHDAGDTEVWTFLGPRPARFWTRRMRNDLVVHRADAALALDEPFEVDRQVACDVIGEGLDLVAAGSAAGLSPGLTALRGEGVLRFSATDVPRAWSVRRSPRAVTWSHLDEPADVTVSGPLTQVLLVLNRRRSPQGLRVEGDSGLLEYWLEHTAF